MIYWTYVRTMDAKSTHDTGVDTEVESSFLLQKDRRLKRITSTQTMFFKQNFEQKTYSTFLMNYV